MLFLAACERVCRLLSNETETTIENLAYYLHGLRSRGGRLFCIGLGGSAANCSHMVNDLRKLCHIEAYAPTDNVAELTARANDEGLHTIFTGWLARSNFNEDDALFVLSVGGGSPAKNVSMGIVHAIDVAKGTGAEVFGIVGRRDGHVVERGDCVVVVPEVNQLWLTPLSESFQAVIWHCLVSHPLLKVAPTKW